MCIALLLARVDRGDVDHGFNCRCGRIGLVENDRTRDVAEPSFDGRDHQVLDGEAGFGMSGVDRPGLGRECSSRHMCSSIYYSSISFITEIYGGTQVLSMGYGRLGGLGRQTGQKLQQYTLFGRI